MFTRLRTEETLGYIVFFSDVSDSFDSGFRVIVQSDTFSPVSERTVFCPVLARNLTAQNQQFVNWRIERCMRYCAQKLRTMEPAAFEKYKASLIIELSQPVQKLTQALNVFWSEVATYQLMFDRRERKLAALKSLTQEEVALYFARNVTDTAARRKFSMQVFGKKKLDLLPSAEQSPTAIDARADSDDMEQARADGCQMAAGAFDTAPLEGPRIVRVDDNYARFKQMHGLLPMAEFGVLDDPKHHIPDDAKSALPKPKH